MEKYYIMINGAQQGPFTKQEIISKGFSDDSYVYNKNLGGWKMISEVAVFSGSIEELPVFVPPINKPSNNSGFANDGSSTTNTTVDSTNTEESICKASISNTQVEYASWGSRLGAYLIDLIIHLVVLGIILYFVFDSRFMKDIQQLPLEEFISTFLVVLSVPMFIMSWFYYALFESSSKQATFGKLIVGLKVQDSKTVLPISFGKATGRHFSRLLLGYIPLINFLDYLAPLWSDKKQAWHDSMSSCVVVKK